MAAFGMPGGAEWVIILVVVLLLFGPSRLPKLGKSIGKTMKAVRDGVDGKTDDDEDEESAAESGSKKAKDAGSDEKDE